MLGRWQPTSHRNGNSQPLPAPARQRPFPQRLRNAGSTSRRTAASPGIPWHRHLPRTSSLPRGSARPSRTTTNLQRGWLSAAPCRCAGKRAGKGRAAGLLPLHERHIGNTWAGETQGGRRAWPGWEAAPNQSPLLWAWASETVEMLAALWEKSSVPAGRERSLTAAPTP